MDVYDLLMTPEQTLLMGLLVIWVVLLFGAFIFGQPHEDNTRRMPTWMRMASSLTLVVAGFMWWVFTDGSDLHTLALWIALGMLCGFIGDLFMARLIIKNDQYVLGGISAFGVGHVAYIIGMIQFGDKFRYDDAATRWGAVIVWLVLGAIIWYVVVYRPAKEPSVLHWAALPYGLLLAATTGFATGLALQNADLTLLAVGAGLFLISDFILAAQLFNGLKFPLISDVVWLTYGPGQMLIVYAVPLLSIL